MTNIVAPVVPQSSKSVDFIARSKAENVTSVAVTETKKQPQVASAEVAAPVVAMTHTAAEPAATNVAEAPKAAIPADLTVPTVATNDVAPTPAVESVAAAPVQEEHDDLMALVQSQPAEEPTATVAEATPENKQVQTVVTAERSYRTYRSQYR